MTAPIRHGLAALLGAAPLVARRRDMADVTLPALDRSAAAEWLAAFGTAADQAAARAFLAFSSTPKGS